MKKVSTFLLLIVMTSMPFGAVFAQSQLNDFEVPELETPELEFPDFGDFDFDTWNPPDDEEIKVPEDCTIPLSDLRTVRNFPPKTGPIIAFGDSLTAGVGATNGQDYVSELERLADVTIINKGISGNTTLDALARLERDVLSQNPSTVIVWLGGNDILNRYYQRLDEEADDTIIERLLDAIFEFFGKDPDREEVITEDETFENLERIIERIQEQGAVVILVGMDGEPLDNNLGGRYENLAEETGVIFVPDVLEDILGRPTLTSDLLHPNNRGYDIVAERIYAGFACVLTESADGDDDQDDEEEEEDNSGGTLRRVCVDSDGDGYRECTYVRDSSDNDSSEDTDSENDGDNEETDEDDTDDNSSGTLRRVCVDSDGDGYRECSYVRS